MLLGMNWQMPRAPAKLPLTVVGSVLFLCASEMSIKKALTWFRGIGPTLSPKKQEIAAKILKEITERLSFLNNVGLDYLTLSRQSGSLSGGEAQRIKLSKELSKRATGKTLYILDEPTTGLHFEDINKLLKVLHTLVEQGNSMIVIEHNLDVIKTADYIVDIGPEGGDGGGKIIAQGTPEQVAKCEASYTAKYLKDKI